MKLIYILCCALFISNVAASAQHRFVFFSHNDKPFQVLINGVLQSPVMQSKLAINNFNKPKIKVEIVFQDNKLKTIKQEIKINDQMNTEFIYGVQSNELSSSLILHASNKTLATDYTCYTDYLSQAPSPIEIQENPTPTPPPAPAPNPPPAPIVNTNNYANTNPSVLCTCSGSHFLNNIESLSNKIEKMDNPVVKLITAKEACKICPNAYHVMLLSEVLVTDADRLELAKYAYACTIDKDKYYHVFSSFKDGTAIRELENYIQNFKK
jgi:hypothetical protein